MLQRESDHFETSLFELPIQTKTIRNNDDIKLMLRNNIILRTSNQLAWIPLHYNHLLLHHHTQLHSSPSIPFVMVYYYGYNVIAGNNRTPLIVVKNSIIGILLPVID